MKYVLGFHSVDDYLTNMERAETWGDGIMLSAASIYFNRPIKVLHSSNQYASDTSLVIDNGSSSSDKPIFLGYVGCGSKANHYVSLIPVDIDEKRSSVQCMSTVQCTLYSTVIIHALHTLHSILCNVCISTHAIIYVL